MKTYVSIAAYSDTMTIGMNAFANEEEAKADCKKQYKLSVMEGEYNEDLDSKNWDEATCTGCITWFGGGESTFEVQELDVPLPKKTIKEDSVYSIQSYCDEFLGFCPVTRAEPGELRKILNENGYENVWDRPISEVDEVLECGLPVVLVDTSYVSKDGIVEDYRWCEVPESKEVTKDE